MTVYEVKIVEFEDLRYILVKCQNCPAQVRMDLAEEFSPTNDRGAFMFLQCPSCRKKFDSAVQPAINQIHEAYQRINGLRKMISFLIEQPG